jgi:enterochelin esterase-like enzyme
MKCPGRNASLFALVSRRSYNLIAVGGGVVPERFVVLAALAAVGVAVASAAQTPEAAPSAQRGTVSEHRISSKVYGRERRVWVYMPPSYSSSAQASYDVLIVFDGREYLEDIRLPGILDDLLAKRRAGPFVAVLVDNASGAERLADLANQPRFADFLGGELLEWARERWKVTRDPRRTFVTGSSAGGLAAAYVAFRSPHLFGNVLSQSGGFWRGNEGSNGEPFEWLTGQFAASPKRDIRFVLEVGSRESARALGGAAPSILEANRKLRDVLRAKGYPVAYAEIPEGTHSTETWKERLPAALASLAGPPERPDAPGPTR